MNYNRHQFISSVLRVFRNYWRFLNKSTYEMIEKNLIIQGQVLSRSNQKLECLRSLSDVEFSVFSQWGEDGIIDWLVSKIPDIKPIFIEFGVENYQESNTRFLLRNRNWKGLVLDSSEHHINDIRSQELYWRYDLTARKAFINIDNINPIIKEEGFEGEIGLLSIDIDGNDYWIWESIQVISPAIVILEYNSLFGDELSLTIPYRHDFFRGKAHHSNLYFGASIKAMINLSKKKGYSLVGTCSAGVNAFFIRDDLSSMIREEIDNITIYPSSFREARDENGKLLFKPTHTMIGKLHDLPLIDTHLLQEVRISDIKDLYSNEWMNGSVQVL